MDHISLHFIQRGEGEPLLLLHGNGEDSSVFSAQMDYFSPKYRVMALDTRGHGKSPRGTAPFSIETFAEDLLDFLDQQGLEKVHLLGFSDGGNIALTFALRHQERLLSLILNGADLFPSGVKPSVQVPIVLGYWAARAAALFSRDAVPKMELLRLMVKDPHIPPEALGAIRVPTLVIAGTGDMIKEEHTRLIHRQIPGSRLVLIPGDHFIAQKNPEPYNRAVEEFLESCAGEESP